MKRIQYLKTVRRNIETLLAQGYKYPDLDDDQKTLSRYIDNGRIGFATTRANTILDSLRNVRDMAVFKQWKQQMQESNQITKPEKFLLGMPTVQYLNR